MLVIQIGRIQIRLETRCRVVRMRTAGWRIRRGL